MYRVVTKFLLLALLFGTSAAYADDFQQARQDYMNAHAALQVGNISSYKKLARSLTAYPLYPYLRYQELRQRLATASDAEVLQFLNTYPDIPATSRLRDAWLSQLAGKKRWQAFIDYYDNSNDVQLRCHYLQAQLEVGQIAEHLPELEQLWLSGSSRPKACDPAFDWFAKSGHLKAELIWERIFLAMENGNRSLAGYLARSLNNRDQDWVNIWNRVHANPMHGLQQAALAQDSVLTRRIIVYGIQRWLNRDLDQAKAFWDKAKNNYGFEQVVRLETDRRFALLAASRNHPEAYNWLNALPEAAVDDKLRLWRVNLALRNTDWHRLEQGIQQLGPEEQERDKWRYWLAKAQAESGHPESAQPLLEALAGERSYYGFLAADLLQRPYALASQSLPVNPETMNSLLENPGVIRARELYYVNQVTEARREWRQTSQDFNPEQIKQAAILASNWGWHDNAIRTIAMVQYWDDLGIRFPTPYQSQVVQTANQHRLEPAWIYGVIRQESAFMPDARSPAGATGLMQLMQATARSIAQRFNLLRPSVSDLMQSDRNIQLGSAYLRQLLNRFDDHQVVATAAYNAGPHRVTGWLPTDSTVPADQWVDTIPFTETRRYVRSVLAYTAIFEWKLNEKPTQLKYRMLPVKTRQTIANSEI